MRDHRHFLFFASVIEGSRLTLDREEAHHAVTVLRLAAGGTFMATDGNGTLFECRTDVITKHGLEATILSRTLSPRHSCGIHSFVGMPERGAFETLLVHCAALGVARITPVIFRRCQSAWWERSWETQRSRFSAKMTAAIKQARYPWLPQLDDPLAAHDAFATMETLCLVADPHGAPFASVVPILQEHRPPLCTVIGPPGGIDDHEMDLLRARGARLVSIAPTRLTTELAAVLLNAEVIAVSPTGALPMPSGGAAA